MSGGGSEVQEQELPGYARDLVKQYSSGAQQLYQTPYEAYPDDRIAGFTPWEQQALRGTAQRAREGSPLVDQAGGMLGDTLSGNYLNANPYVNSMISQAQSGVIDKFNNEITPSTVAQFAQYGGGNITNSGLAETDASNRYSLARALGEIDTSYRMPVYESERSRQFQAVPQALDVANQDYADLQALQGAGQTKRAMTQAQQDLAYQDWLAERSYPYQQLDMLGNAAGIASGRGGSLITGSQQSMWPLLAGGGLMAADIGSQYASGK